MAKQLVGRVKLQGVAELKQSLEALGTEVATKVGVAADRKAAQSFRDHLREVAPYRPGVQLKTRTSRGGVVTRSDYGDLRDNIRMRRVKAEKKGHIIYAVTVGKAFWGYFLEWGTVRMAARPWMRPAFDTWRERLVGVQVDSLRGGIERAAKRLAKIRRRG